MLSELGLGKLSGWCDRLALDEPEVKSLPRPPEPWFRMTVRWYSQTPLIRRTGNSHVLQPKQLTAVSLTAHEL